MSDPRVLQADHVHGRRRDDPIKSGDALYRAILSGARPLDWFQLLCANCQAIKRWEAEECLRREHNDYFDD